MNIEFNWLVILVGLYLVICGIWYYIIFHEHHKRNKIELFEFISLFTKFFVTTTTSLIVIYFGIKCILLANSYKDSRFDVITYLSFGILVISADIINYIFYIKRSLKDLDPEVRENSKKLTIKISDILEIILFTIFVLTPVWKIPNFIEISEDKKKLFIEILKSIGVSICSVIVIYNLNPLNIKSKIKKFFKQKDNKDKI